MDDSDEELVWSIRRPRPRAEETTAEPSERAHKQRRKDKAELQKAVDSRNLQEIVKVLLLLSLQSSQLIRELTGTVWNTFLMEEDSPQTKAFLAAGKHYSEQVKGTKGEHNLGPPYLHVWKDLVGSLKKDSRVQELGKTLLQEYGGSHLLQKSLEEVAASVKYCRLKKAYPQKDKPKTYKLHLAVARIELRTETGSVELLESVVIRALLACGAKRKLGSPPAGQLERPAQQLLDKNFD